MKIKKRNVCVFFVGVFLLVSLQGCDQITTLKEYFLSSTKKGTTPSTLPEQKAARGDALRRSAKKEATQPPLSPNVLARVGSWTITVEEFKERLNALKEVVPEYTPGDIEQDKLILQELINQQLLVQEAERLGLGENKDIKEAVEEFRRTLLVQELARKTVEEIEVTDEEINEFYEINKSDFVEPAQWRVREIIANTEEEAKEILIELYKGADFAETAKLKSQGPTASQGGALGEISVFDFPKQGDIVAALEKGDISRVFKGPKGFYIVKLEDKKGGEQKELEEIKDDIKAGLTMLKQQQVVVDYLRELEGKAEIDINEKLLEE